MKEPAQNGLKFIVDQRKVIVALREEMVSVHAVSGATKEELLNLKILLAQAKIDLAYAEIELAQSESLPRETS